MNKTSVFLLGLIGSIFGLMGSLFWLFIGPTFIAGFLSGITDSLTITDEMYVFGFLLALLQSGVTVAAFIISLVKTIPNSFNKNIKSSGTWALVLGITTFVVNPFHFIPSILLIVGGVLGMKSAEENNISLESSSHHQETA